MSAIAIGVRNAPVVHFSMSIVIPATGLHLEEGEPTKTERILANGSKNYSYVCAYCHSRIYTQRDGSPTINLGRERWTIPVASAPLLKSGRAVPKLGQ
jgi:hypothetical protein